MTNKPTTCYNGLTATEGGNIMPRKKEHELEFQKRPEGIAYRRQYRDEHYARVEINIPPELRDRIYAKAAEEGISRTQLIVKALTAYMEAASESRRKEIKMKTVTFKNCEFTACTAIAVGIGDAERQNAVFVHDINDEFRNGDFVAFGYDLPEDENEAENILSDSSAQSTEQADLDTMEQDG